MAGISISVLGLNEGWLRWLEAPTTAPSWPNVLKLRPRTTFAPITTNVVTPVKSAAAGSTRSKTSAKLRRAIKAACQALIEAEPELTEMDRITGDADLGASMKRAATAIQENLESYPLDDIPATVKALGHTLRQELGGSSGPLYGVLFCDAETFSNKKAPRAWRSGPKQSKRVAMLSANWVVPNQAIGRCSMLSIHL